jgi:hypothetical protein
VLLQGSVGQVPAVHVVCMAERSKTGTHHAAVNGDLAAIGPLDVVDGVNGEWSLAGGALPRPENAKESEDHEQREEQRNELEGARRHLEAGERQRRCCPP